MNPKNLFAELKRRNVYKAAVAYAVVAWLLLQGASIVLPSFEAPAWTMKVLIMVLAVGLPVAVVLAWAFEITPEGIVRAEEVDRNKSITPKTGRKLTAVIIVIGIVAAGLFVFQKSQRRARTAPHPAALNTALSQNEKSIAVLPFENRSEDKTNAYFADGIQDEILTRLAKIGDLKVISRTSTEKYRSRPDNLKIVAEELGVTALLEGSVQKSGGKVRVTVQLIEARSDHHLWAETYDRSLDDVFQVQSEIAGQVAGALQAKLTPQESAALKSVPTRNQKAYDLFLRAEHFVRIARDNFTVGNLPEAIALYRQAVAEDTRFALAYARLSFAQSLLGWVGGAPLENPPEQARSDAEKAVTLQPDLVEAHLALGFCDYWGRLDYARALEHLARAQALAPKNAEVLHAVGVVYRRQLRFDDAITMLERAAQYDPANTRLFDDLAGTYLWVRRNDKAFAAWERALALDPSNEAAATRFANFLIAQRGDVEAARRILRGRGPRLQIGLARTYMLTRDYEQAIRLLEELPADSPAFGPSEGSKDELIGHCLHAAGYDSRARPLLEPARERLASLALKTLDSRQVAFYSIRRAWIEMALGNVDAAIQMAEGGAQSEAVTRDPIYGSIYRRQLAEIYAQAGRKEQALGLISELLKSNSPLAGVTPITLRLAPGWDPLREDPRFQALLKEYPAEGAEKAIKP